MLSLQSSISRSAIQPHALEEISLPQELKVALYSEMILDPPIIILVLLYGHRNWRIEVCHDILILPDYPISRNCVILIPLPLVKWPLNEIRAF